ncbi:MAG: methyltransferase domain-containing protein [Crocinitomicaceae bacterium]|nr:methyltransferase domain-containing protein [Crocinitomicaceae bacterium]MBK8926140.1 methyltransferase domain-containing protein [Crocinitomicaceae bacterium]
MTWEETILHIRQVPEFNSLVRDAYLGANLIDNVERYQTSHEFKALLKLIQYHQKTGNEKILVEIGAGNGIASLAFFNHGYTVVAVEPDHSDTIGVGAIEKLAKHFQCGDKLKIITSYAENIPLPAASADIVFCRQALHHAHELNQFVSEASRLLKPGGIFIAIREHVLSDEKDLDTFLQNHPLQKFYGGEHAYTNEQYLHAIRLAGLDRIKILKHFETPINYMPLDENIFRKKLGILGTFKFIQKIALNYLAKKEKNKPGRLYTYLAYKP